MRHTFDSAVEKTLSTFVVFEGDCLFPELNIPRKLFKGSEKYVLLFFYLRLFVFGLQPKLFRLGHLF